MVYCPMRPYMKCPLYMMNMNEDGENHQFHRQAEFSFVRFLHASPNAPALDIYIDDKKAVTNLTYASIAGYAALPSTTQSIAVYGFGQTANPLFRFTITPDPNSYQTVVISGLWPNIRQNIYMDSNQLLPSSESRLRFVHMSPSAPALDVVTESGKLIFSGVTFSRVKKYITIEPNIYKLRARIAGTPNVVLGLPEIIFSGGKAYTIYAIGLLDGTPPLTAVLLTDGIR